RVQETLARYGVLRLTGALGRLRLESSDPALLRRVAADHRLAWDEGALVVPDAMRGWLKSALAHDGHPVVDEAAIAGGDAVAIALREGVALRPYQEVAVRQFVARSGSGGVVLLPCGAGKTVVGVAAAARLGCWTLVVTPSRTVAEQWREQFLTLTSLAPDQVGFLARGRAPAPVTIATYQALTSRRAGHALALGEAIDLPWGLVIYDEVHALPAEVFRIAATLQSRRRLGLTATLVREDGRERDVFSLVGPPIFSVPWRDLERQGWIAPVDCVEVRVRPPGERALTAERALAAKIRVARDLIARHRGEPTLVVAHRLVEVAAVARALGAPMVT
ncbi:MAG: DEAD/DEAH box helicase family protein, partial [Thermomicrobiaceae bacterium]|nr:DEAD/DEAH box helicase family protein [Thermomicrobiaceae bacterium]